MNRLSISLTLMIILFVTKFTFSGLSDPDFYWHLKTGEYIISTLAIPTSDPFSFTYLGKKWVPHEWLTEIILFSVADNFGLNGIKLLVATICVLVFYLQLKWVKKFFANETKALFLTMIFFVPNLIFFTPRPQIFTFLFFSFFLLCLLDFKYFRNGKTLYYLPLLMILWVNLHGAFIIGIVLLCLFVVAEWCNVLFRHDSKNFSICDMARLNLVTGATILASAINPQHFYIFIYPFQVLNMDVATGMIAEWRSPNFHLLLEKFYLFLIIFFFLLLIYRNKKPDFTEIIMPLFFIVAALTAIRHMPLMSAVLLSLAAVFSNEIINLAAMHKVSLQASKLFRTASREIDPRVTAKLNVTLVLIFTATLTFKESESKISAQNTESLPVEAANFVISNDLEGNFFNSYGIGGYLIYRLAPNRKIFIDGRADIYGDEFINEYMTIYLGKAGWLQAFNKFSFNYVICENDAAIRQLLVGNGSFKQVFLDQNYSVLVRNNLKNSELIEKFSIPKIASN